MVNRNRKDLIVTESADVRKVLQDADYVVTTLRVGGDHSRVMDETIALNAGVIGQETTGVGGFSMAVRTIPILLEYCRLINEIAPNAWIFNLTNPSGLVTQALKSAGYEKGDRHLRCAQQHKNSVWQQSSAWMKKTCMWNSSD